LVSTRIFLFIYYTLLYYIHFDVSKAFITLTVLTVSAASWR